MHAAKLGQKSGSRRRRKPYFPPSSLIHERRSQLRREERCTALSKRTPAPRQSRPTIRRLLFRPARHEERSAIESLLHVSFGLRRRETEPAALNTVASIEPFLQIGRPYEKKQEKKSPRDLPSSLSRNEPTCSSYRGRAADDHSSCHHPSTPPPPPGSCRHVHTVCDKLMLSLNAIRAADACR